MQTCFIFHTFISAPKKSHVQSLLVCAVPILYLFLSRLHRITFGETDNYLGALGYCNPSPQVVSIHGSKIYREQGGLAWWYECNVLFTDYGSYGVLQRIPPQPHLKCRSRMSDYSADVGRPRNRTRRYAICSRTLAVLIGIHVWDSVM